MTESVKESERRRLSEAVATNSPDLLSYFERRVSPPEDAADLLGDTLLVAWRRVADVPTDPHNARLWLFGVARNLLANYVRGKRRRVALAENLRAEVARAHRLEDAPDDRGDAVRAVVAELPDDLRELVMLVHWDGFGVGEAGAILGLSASTARGRYARARQLLASALGVTAGTGPRTSV